MFHDFDQMMAVLCMEINDPLHHSQCVASVFVLCRYIVDLDTIMYL